MTATRAHRVPRIGAATVITVAGGTVMIGGQPAAAVDLVVGTDSAVRDGDLVDPNGPDDLLSLADALYVANETPGLDTITFAIPDPGPHTIDLLGAPPGIKDALVITGPGVDQLTLTNSVGNVLYVYNDADFTVSDLTISSPTTLVPDRAAGIVVADGGTTTVRDVDIDTVALGIWVKDLGVGVDTVLIENVNVDDSENQAVEIGDVESFTVDGLVVTNSEDGIGVNGAQTVAIGGLEMTGGRYGVFASLVDDLVVSDTMITGPSDTAIVNVDGGSTTITGATIDGVLYGIQVRDGVATVDDSVTISDVQVSNASTRAIDIGDVSDVDITGTTITDSGEGIVTDDSLTLDAAELVATDVAGPAMTFGEAGVVNLTGIDITHPNVVGGGGGLLVGPAAEVTATDVVADGVTDTAFEASGLTSLSASGLELTGSGFGLQATMVTGDVTVVGSVFSGNSLGGVRLESVDGAIGVADATITDNGKGGIGISESGPATLERLTVVGNGVIDPAPLGGVLFGPDNSDPSLMTITESTISGNVGDVGGGIAVYSSDVSVSVSDSTISDNTAADGHAVGVVAAFAPAQVGVVTIESSTITGNDGPGSDIVATAYAEVVVDTSTISDNTGATHLAARNGSTLAVRDSTISGGEPATSFATAETGSDLVIESTTVTDTTVGAGGTMFVADTVGTISVESSTIAGNALDATGAMFSVATVDTVSVDSSIVTDNGDGSWLAAGSLAPTVAHSLVPEGSSAGGTDNVEADDPLLGPLQDNGGPTATLLPANASPAIDIGDPAVAPGGTDQRGLERVVGGRQDAGSVERQNAPFVVGLPPARVLETRSGPGDTTIDGEFEGIGFLPDGTTTRLPIVGRAGVPDTAKAVVVNITAVQPDDVGFITVHPCLTNPPLASSLNFRGAVDTGNEIVAELTDDGEICLFNRTGTGLVVDVVGYVPETSRYLPVAPARLLDTRALGSTIDGEFEKGGERASETELALQVAGRGGISDDAVAVVINVTSVKARDVGFVTVHPCLDELPLAASLNFEPDVNRGNEIVAQLDAEGKLCLYTWGRTQLIVDVVGELTDELAYEPVDPARLVETRDLPNVSIDGRQQGLGTLAADEMLRVEAAGRAGVPDDAEGIVANLSAIRPSQRGFITVWDCEVDMPLAASLNYIEGVGGAVVGNELVIDLNDEGDFCLFTSQATDLTVDVVGFTEPVDAVADTSTDS